MQKMPCNWNLEVFSLLFVDIKKLNLYFLFYTDKNRGRNFKQTQREVNENQNFMTWKDKNYYYSPVSQPANTNKKRRRLNTRDSTRTHNSQIQRLTKESKRYFHTLEEKRRWIFILCYLFEPKVKYYRCSY